MAAADLNTLRRHRDALVKARALAIRGGHRAKAATLATQIAALNDRIQARMKAQNVGSRKAPSKGLVKKAPAGAGTPTDSTPITAHNAARMHAHYRALLKKTSIFNLRLRLFYRGRMRTAAAAMRHGRKDNRSAIRATSRYRRAQLREKVRTQRKMAAAAKGRRNYSVAARHDQVADQAEQELRTMPFEPSGEEMDFGPGERVVAAAAGALRRFAPPSMRPASVRGDGPQASLTETPEDVEIDEGAMDPALTGEDEPWYRKYALPLGIAALLGVGLVATRGKGGMKMPSMASMGAASSASSPAAQALKSVQVKVSGPKVRKSRPIAFSAAPRPRP